MMRGAFGKALALAILATAAPVAPAQAQKFFHYDCEGGAHFELMTDRKAVFVQLDGKALRIPRFVSITGTRYRRGDITIWIKGERATLRRAGKRIECKVR
jgi:membrane-bound inhibitor of C-type lysozyme